MNIAEITRLYSLFIERYGHTPNTLLVNDPAFEFTSVMAMRVIVDETSTHQFRIALILDP